MKLNKCTSLFDLKSFDPQGSFCGYASIFNVLDDQGDRVLKGAFHDSLNHASVAGKGLPKMLWQHDASEPIGIWEEIREDDRGLFVKGRLILEIRRAQEAYALMKGGVLDSLSIGYRVVKAFKGGKSGERHLAQLDLFEISLVTFPANRVAKITHLKSKEEDQEIILSELKRITALLRS